MWREQYDRMRRWHYRIWLGVEHLVGGSDQAVVDVFYAFAQTGYHMVDWLENDRTQTVRRAVAETYVDSRPVLAFCRDICNGSKHARLEAKRVSIRTQRMVVGSFPIKDESGQTHQHVVEGTELHVGWGEQFVDAWTFATWCIEEWDRFLLAEGLLPPTDARDDHRTG